MGEVFIDLSLDRMSGLGNGVPIRGWYPLREKGYRAASQAGAGAEVKAGAEASSSSPAKVSTYTTGGKNKAFGEIELVLKWRHNAEAFQASLLTERRRKHEEVW